MESGRQSEAQQHPHFSIKGETPSPYPSNLTHSTSAFTHSLAYSLTHALSHSHSPPRGSLIHSSVLPHTHSSRLTTFSGCHLRSRSDNRKPLYTHTHTHFIDATIRKRTFLSHVSQARAHTHAHILPSNPFCPSAHGLATIPSHTNTLFFTPSYTHTRFISSYKIILIDIV